MEGWREDRNSPSRGCRGALISLHIRWRILRIWMTVQGPTLSDLQGNPAPQLGKYPHTKRRPPWWRAVAPLVAGDRHRRTFVQAGCIDILLKDLRTLEQHSRYKGIGSPLIVLPFFYQPADKSW